MQTAAQKNFDERLTQAVKRATARLARGNVNLSLGRFVTERDIRSELHSAASAFKAAK